MVGAVLMLVVGVAFLFRDLGVLVGDLWNIQGWTVVFLLFGMMGVGHSCCKDCQTACQQPVVSAKKK